MQKNFFKLTFLMTMFGIMLTSCGGVNQSDPQSVAEAVMKCYSADDYKGIIQYVNPEDKHRIKNLEQMQEIADQMKGNGEENKTQPKEITFNEMSDGMMPDEKLPSLSMSRLMERFGPCGLCSNRKMVNGIAPV